MNSLSNANEQPISHNRKTTVLKALTFLRNFSLGTLLVMLFFSCNKDLTPIGLDLFSAEELLSMGYTDTASIVAYSVTDDSVYTANLNYAMIGSMYDPIFGRTTADFYSQVYITTSRVRFGTGAIFDSAFLYLPYQGLSYGDTLSNMTLRVYELTGSIIDSVHTYSNRSVSYDAENLLGEITFQPRPHDSAYFSGMMQAPILRIPINQLFGDHVLGLDTTSLNTVANFKEKFKGICITAEPQNVPGKGAILVMSVPADASTLVMHYHNSADTLTYRFGITTDCSRFNHYDHHGYSDAAPLLKQQIEGDTALGSQVLFLQGMAGIKTKIKFPGLAKWFDKGKIIINDAQLIFTQASPPGVFENPAALTLRAVGATGSTSPFTIVDEDEGSSYFDGTYDETTGTYRFRLTRYVQQVMTGGIDNRNGLYVVIPSASYAGTRMTLNGTSSPQPSVKLYLRFTRL